MRVTIGKRGKVRYTIVATVTMLPPFIHIAGLEPVAFVAKSRRKGAKVKRVALGKLVLVKRKKAKR